MDGYFHAWDYVLLIANTMSLADLGDIMMKFLAVHNIIFVWCGMVLYEVSV